MKSDRYFILYDARAQFDVTSADILSTAFSEQEALAQAGKYRESSIWFEYECIDGDLFNPKPRFDLPTRTNRRWWEKWKWHLRGWVSSKRDREN